MNVEMILEVDKLTPVTPGSGCLTKKDTEELALAKNVLETVASTIRRKHMLLTIFLRVLEWVPVQEEILLETDGQHLFYNPGKVIELLQAKKVRELERRWLHILAHGILGHFDSRWNLEDTELIDCIHDQKADIFLDNCGWGKCFESGTTKVLYQSLGDRELYYEAKNKAPLREKILQFYEPEDDHGFWEGREKYHYLIQLPEDGANGTSGGEENSEGSGQGAAGGGGGASGQGNGQGSQNRAFTWSDAAKLAFGEKLANASQITAIFSGKGSLFGAAAGNGEQDYRASEDNHRSYMDIFRAFLMEACQENQDSIDKILYTFGFDTYGDAALIEPEEYSEDQKLNTMILALDTSGSCSGEIMNDFLREVKNILRDVKGKVRFENILLLQCDVRICEEEWFHRPEELPQMDTYRLKGFGGTDFRPVFKRAEELQKSRTDLKVDCLLYLTDAFGFFPKEDPGYPVFLIVPKDYDSDGIPGWAKVLHMDK